MEKEIAVSAEAHKETIGDQTENEKVESEILYWSDLKDMENEVTNNLVVQVVAIEEMQKIYKDTLTKDDVITKKVKGLTESYVDISKDMEKIINELAPKVYVGDIVRNEDNVITNERKPLRVGDDIVPEEDALTYIHLASRLSTSASELGTFATEAFINLSSELGLKGEAAKLKNMQIETNEFMEKVVSENTVEG